MLCRLNLQGIISLCTKAGLQVCKGMTNRS